MERLKCLFAVGALAVVVSAVAAGPAAAAKGGNNDTAKACQQGGWQTLVPNLGDRFANQGDCVNDGAKGSAPFGTAGHVVKVIGALDVEGNVATALHEGKVATRVGDLWQIDDAAGIEIEWRHNACVWEFT